LNRLCSLILALIVLAGLVSSASPPVCAASLAGPAGFRGVWVATVLNLDYPSQKGLSAAALRSEADAILNGALDMGFNAIVLQVRPTGDALYKSSIFPWSDVLTGEQGKEPPGGFDPLAYFIEGAHSRGMELHAWLNPYRIARNTQNVSGLSADNPARINPSWAVAHSDGHLYYDPGNPEVLEMILGGIREILDNYAVDGIHFDDYFYPGRTFGDDASYRAHGGSFANKDEWRRDNINRLIRDSGKLVRPKNVWFGVSPVAIWANRSNNPLGSDTRGYESYYEQFSDTRKWVLEGWVDYIAPQIYWEIGRENSDYAKVLAWWADLVRDTGVDLYVGHATYLMNGNNSRPAWAGVGEIARQYAENAKYPAVTGSIHFRYRLIAGDSAIAGAVKALAGGTSVPASTPVPQAPGLVMPTPSAARLAVGRPDRNVTFNGENYYITGASNPNEKLTVNGKEITNRTPGGYFSYYAALRRGANVFTFEQGNTKVTRTITRPSGVREPEAPEPMPEAVIRPGVFPDGFDEIRRPGDTVQLTCTAPIGADVSVRIGGQTLQMTPDTTTQPTDGRLYATNYRASYTFPDIKSGNAPVLTIGTPLYTMTMGGTVSTRAASGTLKISTSARKLVAEVTSRAAFVFPGPTTTGGPAGELSWGQIDTAVTQQNGLWVELGCGMWLLRSDLRFLVRDSALQGSVTGAEYRTGARWDTLTVRTDTHSAALASWNGRTLTFTVHAADGAPNVSLPAGALIGRANASLSGGAAVYTLTPATGAAIDGYYIEPVPAGIRLHIKRRPAAKAGNRPLEGITIMVDAGHGGTDTGAFSPIGAEYAEKHINRYAALKLRNVLQNMGATVILTRASDATTSLQSRLDLSRSARPDLFVSLHCNSMGEDVNSDSIRGVVVLYREQASQAFSEHMYDHLRESLGVQGRGVRSQNLYVCRGTWAPHTLIELGFINNPFDYEWLIDNAEQDTLVKALAEGILGYFR
jgi:uncharacterized lipoprotein YddW (UPF0748 family)/N-acetylmuramoyl-L-alanine amidase